ncbi:MAG: hypothetical protein ABJG94_08045, partial [Nitratireductor sp.]
PGFRLLHLADDQHIARRAVLLVPDRFHACSPILSLSASRMLAPAANSLHTSAVKHKRAP